MPAFKQTVKVFSIDLSSDVVIELKDDLTNYNTMCLSQLAYEAPPSGWLGAVASDFGEISINFHRSDCSDMLSMFSVNATNLDTTVQKICINVNGDEPTTEPTICFHSLVNGARISPTYLGHVTLRIIFLYE